jgi:hypothetical protein
VPESTSNTAHPVDEEVERSEAAHSELVDFDTIINHLKRKHDEEKCNKQKFLKAQEDISNERKSVMEDRMKVAGPVNAGTPLIAASVLTTNRKFLICKNI